MLAVRSPQWDLAPRNYYYDIIQLEINYDVPNSSNESIINIGLDFLFNDVLLL